MNIREYYLLIKSLNNDYILFSIILYIPLFFKKMTFYDRLKSHLLIFESELYIIDLYFRDSKNYIQ